MSDFGEKAAFQIAGDTALSGIERGADLNAQYLKAEAESMHAKAKGERAKALAEEAKYQRQLGVSKWHLGEMDKIVKADNRVVRQGLIKRYQQGAKMASLDKDPNGEPIMPTEWLDYMSSDEGFNEQVGKLREHFEKMKNGTDEDRALSAVLAPVIEMAHKSGNYQIDKLIEEQMEEFYKAKNKSKERSEKQRNRMELQREQTLGQSLRDADKRKAAQALENKRAQNNKELELLRQEGKKYELEWKARQKKIKRDDELEKLEDAEQKEVFKDLNEKSYALAREDRAFLTAADEADSNLNALARLIKEREERGLGLEDPEYKGQVAALAKSFAGFKQILIEKKPSIVREFEVEGLYPKATVDKIITLGTELVQAGTVYPGQIKAYRQLVTMTRNAQAKNLVRTIFPRAKQYKDKYKVDYKDMGMFSPEQAYGLKLLEREQNKKGKAFDTRAAVREKFINRMMNEQGQTRDQAEEKYREILRSRKGK